MRTPADQQAIVVVQGTGGDGLWLRREPGGEPLQVWPDGTPMLVSGADQQAGGRTWRHVFTFDGGSGWAASDYLTPADPRIMSAALAAVNGSAARRTPRDGSNGWCCVPGDSDTHPGEPDC